MKCPNCGAKNPNNAVFCENCGSKIEKQKINFKNFFKIISLIKNFLLSRNNFLLFLLLLITISLIKIAFCGISITDGNISTDIEGNISTTTYIEDGSISANISAN